MTEADLGPQKTPDDSDVTPSDNIQCRKAIN